MAELQSVTTLPSFLENSAKIHPDKVGLVFEDSQHTYQQINKRANQIANFIAQRTNKGDVVATLLPNSDDFIFIYFGILKAGCIALLLQPTVSDDRFLFQLEKTYPKLLFSLPKYQKKLERTKALELLEYVNTQEIPTQSDQPVDRVVLAEDTSTIIFTSGTTSDPKGVKLQHDNVVNATKNIIEFLNWETNDVDVNISALSHSFGLGHIHCSFAMGGTTILFRDAINLRKILETIIEHKATNFGAVPATLRLLLENYKDELAACDPYLKFVQTDTSLLEKELITGIMETLPTTNFSYYYGLTEASRSTFVTFNENLDKLDSVGPATPNVELRIADHTDTTLPTGEIGEICIKGKHVINEYWENPEASKKIKNDWLHTGDAGYLDEDGFLYFKGRRDDIINVSGEKLTPEEVEDFVKKIPGVSDVAAIGIADKLLGEAVKLFISTDVENLDLDKIRQACNQLESYKRPKEIEVINEIPRTENGKLKRNALK